MTVKRLVTWITALVVVTMAPTVHAGFYNLGAFFKAGMTHWYPTYVQSISCRDPGSISSSRTCNVTPTAGNTLVVFCFSNATDGVYSISDNKGNTYVIDGTASSAATYSLIAHASSITGSGAFTITCSKTLTQGYMNVFVAEYTGLLSSLSSSAFDLAKSGSGTTANPSTSGATPTGAANDLLVSGFASSTGSNKLVAPGPGYFLREGNGGGSHLFASAFEDRTVSAVGNYQGSFFFNDTANWSQVMVAYKVSNVMGPNPSGKLVQGNTNSQSGTSVPPNQSVAFQTNNTAGNFIWVGVRLNGSGRTLTVSDTAGNTYNQAAAVTQTTDNHQIWIYYAMNIAGGANTISANATGANALNLAMYVAEYSGVATSGALDQTSTAIGNGTSVNSGATASTTAANELLTGMIGFSGSGMVCTPTGGFAREGFTTNSSTNLNSGWQDRLVSSTGTYSSQCTIDTTNDWSTAIATFKLQ